MTVTVDWQACIGSGMCALTTPAVFGQDDEQGTVILLHARPPARLHHMVQVVVTRCPVGAITAAISQS